MSARPEMPPARTRPIPGMASNTQPTAEPTHRRRTRPGGASDRRRPGSRRARLETGAATAQRRPALDYGATRLVNFRLPVDLHDRFKALVREAEPRHPRLRHPSLTELVIALLEEAPSDADESPS